MRKIHKINPLNCKVICGQRDDRLFTTDVDQDVTCVLCVRKIIGQPRRGVKKILSMHSVHIRRAVSPLGLLKG